MPDWCFGSLPQTRQLPTTNSRGLVEIRAAEVDQTKKAEDAIYVEMQVKDPLRGASSAPDPGSLG
jgi:hypothetical protein